MPSPDRDDVVPASGKQPAPSMAQQLGLVPMPPSPLTKKQWAEVGRVCAERSAADPRGEDTGPRAPCAICREPLVEGAQVLLSCSHVFHRACLRSYEEFSGHRVCPLCRCREYRKLTISTDRDVHMTRCAIRIQAAWRGFMTRKWYARWSRMAPRTDAERAIASRIDRLAVASDALLAHIDHERALIDAALNDIESTVSRTRQVYATFGPDYDWSRIVAAANDRGTTACPICLAPLLDPSLYEQAEEENAAAEGVAKKPQRRGVTILSCTHVFHTRCVLSFEQFNTGGLDTCPICRAVYSRRPFDPPRKPASRRSNPEQLGIESELDSDEDAAETTETSKPTVPALDLRKAYALRPMPITRGHQAAAERAAARVKAAAAQMRTGSHVHEPPKRRGPSAKK
eukprot:m51a1_g2390 hypothetical protein (400) ;mRNA; f:726433-727833